MKSILILVATCLLLAGCAADQPVPYLGIGMPAECTAADPSWVDLPDRDVTRSELARNYATNKERFRSVTRNRRICRAGIEASS